MLPVLNNHESSCHDLCTGLFVDIVFISTGGLDHIVGVCELFKKLPNCFLKQLYPRWNVRLPVPPRSLLGMHWLGAASLFD